MVGSLHLHSAPAEVGAGSVRVGARCRPPFPGLRSRRLERMHLDGLSTPLYARAVRSELDWARLVRYIEQNEMTLGRNGCGGGSVVGALLSRARRRVWGVERRQLFSPRARV